MKGNLRANETSKKSFDTEKYLEIQTASILERVSRFSKLYLEFGGKLCYDFHAARVLPGYDPRAKMMVLNKLKERIEIVYCVSAKDIQKGKIRSDYGLTYDNQALRDINDIEQFGLSVSAVVISMFEGQALAEKLKRKLQNMGYRVCHTYEMRGYPEDIKFAVSEDGLGSQPYVETEKPIVIVTGTGPNSCKTAFCLSQLYHDTKKGIDSGYAKFETFPIWNLPLEHPVNIAYEAATADLKDINMIDPFHLSAYNKTAVNYNRDIENFSVMKKILESVVSENNFAASYKSPTDMGVNMAGFAIINDGLARQAAKQEIIRRHFRYKREFVEGAASAETVEAVERLMKKLGIAINDRKTVSIARKAAEDAEKTGRGNKSIFCGAAVELPNGEIVSGKNSPLLHAESAAILNAVKKIAGIPKEKLLLDPDVLQHIGTLKKNILRRKSESLNLEEALIALAISAATSNAAELALRSLVKLKNCEMHITHMPSEGDEAGLRKLSLNVTTDALLAR